MTVRSAISQDAPPAQFAPHSGQTDGMIREQGRPDFARCFNGFSVPGDRSQTVAWAQQLSLDSKTPKDTNPRKPFGDMESIGVMTPSETHPDRIIKMTIITGPEKY